MKQQIIIYLEELLKLTSEMLSIVSKSEPEPHEYEHYDVLLQARSNLLDKLTGELNTTAVHSEVRDGVDQRLRETYDRLVAMEHELWACLDNRKQGVFDQLQKIRNLRASKDKYSKPASVNQGHFLSVSTEQ